MSAVSRTPVPSFPVDTSQPISEPVSREQIIEDASLAVLDKLDGVMCNVRKLMEILQRDLRTAAGRSPSDNSNDRQHHQPERVAATLIASITRRSLGEYPECWDVAALDDLLEDIPDPPVVVPLDVRMSVTGKLAAMWREVVSGDVETVEPKSAQSVNWTRCEDELPDDEVTVMIAIDDDEPVWMGYHDSSTDGWYSIDQMRFNSRVTHWAELPETPKQLG